MKVRRCTIKGTTAILDSEGIWVPWDDHEAVVEEYERRVNALAHSSVNTWEEETEVMRLELAETLDKNDELKRKLASARSQLSRYKKKREV